MNVSRIAILGVAVVAGAGAFALMLGQNKDVSPVQIVEPVREETVRVLVSSRDIQRGERLMPEDTSWIAWPKKAVQPSFITDANPDARDELESAVARSLIVTGEPVVNAKLVHAGSSGLMAAILSPGMRAVTMRVSPETSSGGFILPGDRVDILFTGGRGDGGNAARTIFENVRILAVDTLVSENTEASNVGASNVTLELAPTDAEMFISARESGSLSLTLRSIFKPETDETTERRSSNVSVIRYGRS